MPDVPGYGLEVNEFELQSLYYVHFQTNILGKGMGSFIPLVSQIFFNKDGFGIK